MDSQWQKGGDRIHHALLMDLREKMDREVSPTAVIIDSQTAKSAEKWWA